MTKREMILRNVRQWKANQVRKAHKADPDCPPNTSHVRRAKKVSAAIEDWSIEQRRLWAEKEQEMAAPLRYRPFVFGDE